MGKTQNVELHGVHNAQDTGLTLEEDVPEDTAGLTHPGFWQEQHRLLRMDTHSCTC